MKIPVFRVLLPILALIPIFAFPQTLETFLRRETLSAAVDIAFDPRGDLILLGHRGPATDAAYGNRDGFLAKYSRQGELLWETDVWSDYSRRSALALDERGRIYVAFDNNFFQLHQYDTDGHLLWEKVIPEDSPQENSLQFRSAPGALMAADGAIYVGAQFSGTVFFEADSLIEDRPGDAMLLARFSESGAVEWVRQLDAPGLSSVVFGLTRDYEGNLILSGSAFLGVSVDSFELRSNGQMGYLAKWTPEGGLLWLRSFNDEAFSSICRGVAVDKQNNLYAVGRVRGPTIRKFNAEGEVVWTDAPLPVNSDIGSGRWNDVAIDGYGTLYVAGNMAGTLTFDDRIVTGAGIYESEKMLARYALNGTLEEIQVFPGNELDNIFSIATFGNELYLAGYTGGVVGTQSIPFENYLTVEKYLDHRPSVVTRYQQEVNLFPNPNTGRFCLYLDDEFREDPTVTLFDSAGRQLYRRQYPAIAPADPFLVLDLPELAAGVYVLDVRSNARQRAVRMVVEK